MFLTYIHSSSEGYVAHHDCFIKRSCGFQCEGRGVKVYLVHEHCLLGRWTVSAYKSSSGW